MTKDFSLKLLSLKRLGFLSLFAYALLLTPTFIFLWGYFCQDAPINHTALSVDQQFSSFVNSAWRPDKFSGWSVLGVPPKSLRTILEIIKITGIIMAGLAYVLSCKRLFCSEPDDSESEKLRMWIQRSLLWTCFILIWVIPFNSRDLYGYIDIGVLQLDYGKNPYLDVISSIPNWQTNPMLHEHWADSPKPYGFLFNGLCWLLAYWAQHSFIACFLIFKTLNSLALFAASQCFFYLARYYSLDKPLTRLFIVACNPLILLQTVAIGHNDILLSVLILAAFWALTLKHNNSITSMLFLTASLWIKYVSGVFFPGWVVLFWIQKSWRNLFLGCGSAIALTLLLGLFPTNNFLNFYHGMTQTIGISQFSVHSFCYRTVYYLAHWLSHWFPSLNTWIDPFASVLKQLLLAVSSALILWLWLGFYQFSKTEPKPSEKMLSKKYLETGTLSLIILIMIASSVFHSWYITLFFPLVFLIESRPRLLTFVWLLSLFHLLSFTALQNIHILNVLLLTVVPLAWAWRRPIERPLIENF
ncbi:MAG: glycosyltransferase 87 family protein [Cyanobacteria bacterium]|nr:glycosyltransferase 87 family protein [Cyanobacteriota bacterium]